MILGTELNSDDKIFYFVVITKYDEYSFLESQIGYSKSCYDSSFVVYVNSTIEIRQKYLNRNSLHVESITRLEGCYTNIWFNDKRVKNHARYTYRVDNK